MSDTTTQTGSGPIAAPDGDEGCPPFLAVGSDELGDPLGETVDCRRCGATHPVEYGERRLPDGTWEPSRTLAFCRCAGVTYLVGINGRKWAAGGGA